MHTAYIPGAYCIHTGCAYCTHTGCILHKYAGTYWVHTQLHTGGILMCILAACMYAQKGGEGFIPVPFLAKCSRKVRILPICGCNGTIWNDNLNLIMEFCSNIPKTTTNLMPENWQRKMECCTGRWKIIYACKYAKQNTRAHVGTWVGCAKKKTTA